jgi:SEC-C motif-containing protein
MRKVERNEPCPCGSGLKFKKCCAPAIDGTTRPETAEALMRSRYTAYVVGNAAYLYETTHPDNEAVKGVDRDQFIRETQAYCKIMDFTGLTVHQTWPEDEKGIARVEFTAHFEAQGQQDSFKELSDFVRLNGRWIYLSGYSPEAHGE